MKEEPPAFYAGECQFTSGYDSQKARNLAHQPWTVVHCGDGDDVIILEGEATLVTDEDERQRIDSAYQSKYVDPYSGARATILEEGCNLYRVNVKHVMRWEYGTISTRTDWRF